MDDINIRIFGPTGAGKTVYLVMLYEAINQEQLNPLVIDPSDDMKTIQYLGYVGNILINKGSTSATPARDFIELRLKLVYNGYHEESGKQAALISTYDLSGEDIDEIFDPKYHSDYRKAVIPSEWKDSQKKIMSLLYSGNSFIFLIDPLCDDFDEQDTMFAIIMQILKKSKLKKKGSTLDDLKISFCLSKGDLINFPDPDNFLRKKMPLSWKYGKLNFKERFRCFTISSLGAGAEERTYPIKSIIKSVNVVEPVRFFIENNGTE